MSSVRQAWVLVYSPPYLGKTTLLYSILVKRLLDKKPTILQNSTQYLIFFRTNGVTFIPPRRSADPELEEYRKTWALVDINFHVETPAEALGEPFFLVMASSPRALGLRKLQKYWVMKPFTLAELIRTSVFLTSISSFVTYAMFQTSSSTRSSRRVRYQELL